jgi:hypothetical protein
MARRSRKLLLALALAATSAGLASSEPLRPLPVRTPVVPALADPAVLPGIARCTSDGRCVVTDRDGTRRGSRHAFSR